MKTSSKSPEIRRAYAGGLHFILMVFLFSIFVNLLMLVGPLFMLQVYDRVLGSGSEETLVALFILVGVLYAFMAMLDFARGRLTARFGAQFQETLDPRVFSALIHDTNNPRDRRSVGSGLRDVETIQTLSSSPILLALCDIPWSPIFFGAIFIFHPMLGWLGLFGGAVLICITVLNQLLTRRKTADAQKASSIAHNFSDRTLQASEIILSQGMQTDLEQRWKTLRDTSLNSTMRASDWTGVFTATTKAFRLFLQSAMLALGAYLVLRGEMTAGAMIAGSILLGRALQPIEQTLGGWAQIQRGNNAVKSLAKLLNNNPQTLPKHGLSKPKPELTLEGVTIVPPGAQAASLKQVSFKVPAGQAIGIIGKSGAGKSTLARAITGVWPARMGEIRLGGATLDQYDQGTLGKLIGYLPQKVTLFPGTIAENIARMSLDVDSAAVEAAARRAHAHDLIIALPQGYDTQMDGENTGLSGGQVQRIALARALYGNPILLILDEPNSALDADGSAALNKAIQDHIKLGNIALIMTHRPSAIAHCSQLVVLDQGMVRAQGPRDEVLKKLVTNAKDIRPNIPQGPKS